MKILFSHSYYYPLDAKQWEKKQPYPPLGTIQAAAYMRQNGHAVALHDTNLTSDPELLMPKLDSFSPELVVLYDDGFNYLTKMCLTNMREAALAMIRSVAKKGIPVLVSSSDSTDHYDLYLDAGATGVMLGEAEETLAEFVSTYGADQDLGQITGLAYRAQNETVVNPKRPVIRDLDKLPMPAWDLVDVPAYKRIWKEGNGYFSLNIATTRGCPFKCNWCAKPIYGNRYNSRSPEHVAKEIEYLIANFQPDHFWMCDDIFGLKPGWAQEFEKLVSARKLKFRYTIQSRVDLLLKEDTIDALVGSGIEEIWVGAESGSQKVLDAMDKGTDVNQIYEATRLLKKKGVKIAFFLQFGYPEETQEDIQKTIDMVLELMPDNVGVSVSYPLPGTPFYDRVQSELVGKKNWTDSDDLDLMFANTYPPDYYRRLQRYIHRMLRLKQGKQSIKSFFGKQSSAGSNSLRSAALFPYYQLTTQLDLYALNQLQKRSK